MLTDVQTPFLGTPLVPLERLCYDARSRDEGGIPLRIGIGRCASWLSPTHSGVQRSVLLLGLKTPLGLMESRSSERHENDKNNHNNSSSSSSNNQSILVITLLIMIVILIMLIHVMCVYTYIHLSHSLSLYIYIYIHI